MNRKVTLFVALVAFLVASLVVGRAARATTDEVVTIKSGPIKGKVVDGVHIYLGVPYAAPPVGDLRWKPPVAPKPWTEAREARQVGYACPQISNPLIRGVGEMDEDCLTLNVWTAARSRAEARPVMFWIYGGGFYVGSTAQAEYDGAALAKKGAVIVTVNYRVGALGFLAHPALSGESSRKVSGNYGMLDVVFALKWVKENIREFGGDPDNVTIFGQSAGAAAVSALLTSPLGKGLFHRAIAHSGSASLRLRYRAETRDGLESMESLGVEFAKRLGVANERDVLKAMRAKPWAELLEAVAPASSLPGGGTLAYLSVDGEFLQEPPGRAFAAGTQMNVPLIAGTTSDEGTIFNRGRIDTLEKYRQYIGSSFGTDAEEALTIYPANDDASAARAFNDTAGDAFVCGARRLVRAMSRVQPQTWLYQFTRVPKRGIRNGLGAYHLVDLFYVFHVPAAAEGFSPEDETLSEEMMNYWVRFAKTGDPNGGDAMKWPAYQTTSDQHLILGAPIGVGKNLRAQSCNFLERRIR